MTMSRFLYVKVPLQGRIRLSPELVRLLDDAVKQFLVLPGERQLMATVGSGEREGTEPAAERDLLVGQRKPDRRAKGDGISCPRRQGKGDGVALGEVDHATPQDQDLSLAKLHGAGTGKGLTHSDHLECGASVEPRQVL